MKYNFRYINLLFKPDTTMRIKKIFHTVNEKKFCLRNN